MEELSPGFEGYLSLDNFLKIGIKRGRFEILVKVEVLDLNVQKNIDSKKTQFFYPKKVRHYDKMLLLLTRKHENVI